MSESLPHTYSVSASAQSVGEVQLQTPDGARLTCRPPPQFGGEPGHQSPEVLLTEAVAGCYILTFRAIAGRLDWQSLSCQVEGTLDKVEGAMRFTGFHIEAELQLGEGGDRERALTLMRNAEKYCLVSASLACPVTLDAQIAD